ncbi:hypothetical protein [Bacillus sp. V33-4]|uniref:hypothetical protein n=1 Tax=Bacillus sp. V33-4 TaxID=2054169 RepID=UPI000C76AB58|nr:hypothetical protein [Bacillus sp. V33-4]PLR86469.1 hypothetical protein CVD23_06560 [Bacillus sp. V33-4]
MPERNLKKDPNKPTIDLGTGKVINDQITTPGTISTQEVLGTDGRQKVDDTSVTPHRQISHIELEYADVYASCSGTVISRVNGFSTPP